MTGRKIRLAILAAVSVLGGTSHSASGADLGSGPPRRLEDYVAPAKQWTLNLTPYGWLTGLNGSTTVNGRTTDIDIDAFKILRHLDGVPWMSYAEARKGRLALYNDTFYAPLGVDASGTRSFGGVTLDPTLDVDIEQAIIEAGAAYEVARWRSGVTFLLGYTAIGSVGRGALLAPERRHQSCADRGPRC